MAIRSILFDMDGTLLDTLDDLTEAVNYCMELFGEPSHTRGEVHEMVGNGVYVLMERALPGGRDNPRFDDCIQAFLPYYQEHMMDHTAPFDGIGELLAGLKERGYGMAVVSNKFDAATKDLNRRFFEGVIPVAIGEKEAEGIRKKPAPDVIFAAAGELGSKPEECLCVGDSEVDIQTAANAGIPCICVTWGFKSREFLEENGADHVADTPRELLEKIVTFED